MVRVLKRNGINMANCQFCKIDNLNGIENKNYITYNFEPISQIMRIFIANDLKIKDKYDWRKYHFDNNIKNTLKDLIGKNNLL